jgi:hypothetical protein
MSVHGSQNVARKAESAISPSDFPVSVRNAEVTDRQMMTIAKTARDHWLMIGVHLGFQMAELRDYEEQEPKSLYGRLFRLLADWKARDTSPVLAKIIAACKEVGVEGAVKRALQDLEK